MLILSASMFVELRILNNMIREPVLVYGGFVAAAITSCAPAHMHTHTHKLRMRGATVARSAHLPHVVLTQHMPRAVPLCTANLPMPTLVGTSSGPGTCSSTSNVRTR